MNAPQPCLASGSRGLAGGAVRLAGLLLAGLISAVTPGRAQDRVVALTSDYTTGSLAVLGVDPPWSVQADLVPTCGDAVIRAAGGLLYVVNRTGCDNIEVINPAGWSVVQEFSAGIGTNPQDIAVVTPARAYVSRYETNDLLEVNPQTGAFMGTISLQSFADSDGLCEMHRMLIRGNRLFVEVQRMYRSTSGPWLPEPPSLLVVIDLDTRSIVDADPALPGTQGIALAGTNPIAPIQVDLQTRELLVPEAGQYGVLDAAGIERVDPVALQSRGFLVTEQALGGDLVDFAQWSPTRGYAVVSLAGFNTALLSYNPATGQETGVVYNPGGYVLGDLLVYPTGRLFLSDRDYNNPGLRVFDAGSGALLAGPISTGLPPNDLVLLPGSTSGVEGPDPASGPIPGLSPAYPNPSTGPVRLAYRGMSADPPRRLDILDVQGRLVRSIDLQSASPAADLQWDGRDASGRPAPGGVYQLRLVTESGHSAVRPVRIVR